jgi:pimeloyl-ACP methyl ester carboxylesterase
MNKILKKAGIEERFFDTGEIKLNYVAGPPNGTPLVFIPGQGVTWEEYMLLLPKLAHCFQVFAVTLRGHGKSTFTPGKYTFNILGKDMTAFLRDVVGKPAIVGGNSSGGVLSVWLAANSPEWVKGVICEDPPFFLCEWPTIKTTWVYDVFLMLVEIMGTPGGGGLPKYFKESINLMGSIAKEVMNIKLPPKFIINFISKIIAIKLFFRPNSPVDLKFLPPERRILLKGNSQFDVTFTKAFLDGSVGKGFDHAIILAKVAQPMLFLHANWYMYEGRILGAIGDEEVARVKLLVKGSWKYVRMKCGHGIPIEKPDEESKEIIRWVDEYLK